MGLTIVLDDPFGAAVVVRRHESDRRPLVQQDLEGGEVRRVVAEVDEVGQTVAVDVDHRLAGLEIEALSALIEERLAEDRGRTVFVRLVHPRALRLQAIERHEHGARAGVVAFGMVAEESSLADEIGQPVAVHVDQEALGPRSVLVSQRARQRPVVVLGPAVAGIAPDV